VTKEKRLGRGLEALLGQIPSRGEAALPAQLQRAQKGATQEGDCPNFRVSENGTVPFNNPLDMPIAQSNEAEFGIAPHQRTEAPPDFFEYPSGNSLPAINTPHNPSEKQPGDCPNFRVNENGTVPFEPPRVRIDRIDSNPHQPRQDFDPGEIKKLSESISAHGLLQPVVVRRVDDRYQIIAGERRLRAAAEAGWSDVPVNIIEADDRQTAELAIIENLQRKDLNALEKAACFQRYIEQYGCTQEELASRLNMDRSTIANMIRLLELPNSVQDALRRGELTPGHARALLPLGDEREQVDFCARIKREGLNVRQTEALVQETIDAADEEPLAVVDREGRSSKVAPRNKNEHLAALEQEFRAALGIKKVQITSNARGRGKLVIHFRNHEEFDQVQSLICGGEQPDIHGKVG
jgi:ParB family transcriptional regulator, chromosome partitioning protein